MNILTPRDWLIRALDKTLIPAHAGRPTVVGTGVERQVRAVDFWIHVVLSAFSVEVDFFRTEAVVEGSRYRRVVGDVIGCLVNVAMILT
jgi:hypothetical protein